MSGAPVGSAHRRRLRGVVQVLHGEITTALLSRVRGQECTSADAEDEGRGERVQPNQRTQRTQRTNETKERNQEQTIKEQGSRSKNETNKINKQINQQTQWDQDPDRPGRPALHALRDPHDLCNDHLLDLRTTSPLALLVPP
jgi:hypothetical protein